MKKVVTMLTTVCLVLLISTLCLASYQLWRVDANGNELKQITRGDYQYPVHWIFSANGKNIIAGGQGKVDLFDLEGKLLKHYEGGKDYKYFPVACINGTVYLSIVKNDQVTEKLVLLDEATWKKKSEVDLQSASHYAVSKDLLVAYSIKKGETYDGFIRNLTTGQTIAIGKVSLTPKFEWTNDGTYLAFTNAEGEFNRYGVVHKSGSSKSVSANDGTSPLAWSGNNNYLLVSDILNGVTIIDSTTWKPMQTFESMNMVMSAAWAPNHKAFAFSNLRTVNDKLTSQLYKGYVDGTMKRVIDFGEDFVVNLQWTPDGKYLYFSRMGNGPVKTGEEALGYDFRKTRWGMTKQEVIKSEGTLVPEEDGNKIYYYDVNTGGLDALLFYEFNKDGKLCQSGYFFTEKHTNENLYIQDYESIKQLLVKKYGEPYSDDMDWNRTLYKDDPERYGFAVSIGDLIYRSVWDLDKTYISLSLSGDEYEIYMGVFYYSNEFSDEEDEDSSDDF